MLDKAWHGAMVRDMMLYPAVTIQCIPGNAMKSPFTLTKEGSSEC